MHDRLPLPQSELDRSSTGKRNTSIGKRGYWERNKVFDLPRPNEDNRLSRLGIASTG